jgi:type IV pilus assembly protein PilC
MVLMAEETGMLPEVLANLADHYDNNLKLRKTFVGMIAWPVIQLVAAILIIALLILILGLIAESRGGEPINIFWGLSGMRGAIIWLTATFGTLFGLVVAYFILVRVLGGQRFVDPLLLRVPVLGSCLRSFAIARFSWAYYLTQQTGMPIRRSIDSSLRATANGAFMSASPALQSQLAAGEELTNALADTGLFPAEYIEMVHVGENAGTVPEMLHRLSPQFEEQARRSLSVLAAALGWLVWAAVATFIIFLVFKVFLWYVGMINEAAKGL